jgi:membrane-associated phospholipid phosphatase
MVPWRRIPWALSFAVVVLSSAALAEETKAEKKPLAPATPLGPVDKNTPKLFHQIGLDFKNVFTTKENLWILGAGAGASLLAHPYDEGIVNSRFNRELYEGGALDASFESGKVLGGTLFQVGAAFTTYAIGKASSDPELTSLGRDLVRAQIVTQGLTQAVKLAVQRPRPDGSDSFSFPSGHSSSAFATATVLQRHYGWKVGAPAYGFAGYVAASRLSENKHHLSDVIFGATIGILVGRTVTFGVGDSRFVLSPMVVPRGAGVQLSLLH